MKHLVVRKYTKEDKIIWDNFIENGKNCSFLFKRDFMDYHKDRFLDYSLLVFEKNKLIGALPAHKVDNRVIASHLGLSYGGFVFRKTETHLRALHILHRILFYLKSHGIEKIQYRAFPKFYNAIGSEEIDHGLFLIKAKLKTRQFASAINLKEPFKKNRRRNTNKRKAIRSGVVIREVTHFNSFWEEILVPNLKNRYDAAPVHNLEEITKLHKRFPSNIRQFNAYLNKNIIAGATVFESSNVARVQYNSANMQGKIVCASDLLYSELIDNFFKHKNYFDFGTSFDINGLNVGLLNWKENFGARSFSVETYEMSTKNHILLEQFMIKQNPEYVAKFYNGHLSNIRRESRLFYKNDPTDNAYE